MHLCCEVVFQTFLSVLVHACDLHSQGPLSTGAWWPEDLLFISGACCSGWGQHLTWVGIYSWFFSGGAEEGWRCWSGGGEAAKPQQSKQGCISRAARKCLATVCSAHHRCCVCSWEWESSALADCCVTEQNCCSFQLLHGGPAEFLKHIFTGYVSAVWCSSRTFWGVTQAADMTLAQNGGTKILDLMNCMCLEHLFYRKARLSHRLLG